MEKIDSIAGRGVPFQITSQQEYWPEKTVAHHIGMSVSWLRKMRNLGQGIRFHKLENGSIRYFSLDVKKYMEASRCSFTGQHDNSNEQPVIRRPKNAWKHR